jgi:transposase
MFFPEGQLRIWLYTEAVDMRKSYNGLSALVKGVLQDDPASGQIYVFVNRKRTQMKALYYDRSGYCIWAKRLEQGRFQPDHRSGLKVALDWTRLRLLVEGISLQNSTRYKRYQRPSKSGQ